MPRLLRRLATVGALTCALNGGAAFLLVQNDAGRVRTVATAEIQDLQEVDRVVDALSTSTGDSSPAGQETRRQATEAGAARIAAATARAAAGPTQFTGDVQTFGEMSGAFARYAALVEVATSTTGATSTSAKAEADRVRNERLAPLSSTLQATNGQRSEGARFSALGTGAVLGLTSLATLLALLGGSRWLASRTKRVVNPGLAGALVTSAAVSGYGFAQAAGTAPTAPGAGPLLLVGGLAAAGLVWFGVDQRLKEYR